jgi:hypothetical protein
MAEDPIAYLWSDAWLLLSIIYASREHDATLGEILMVGDYINHTNFTQEELDGGFSRLKDGNLITKRAATFAASEKALIAYKNIGSKGLSALQELQELESLLGIKNAP